MAIEDRVQLIKETGWRQRRFRATEIYARRCNVRDEYPAGGWYRKAELAPSRTAQSTMRQIAPRRCLGESHAGFCPEPFAGINTANIAGVVNVARRVAQTGNLFASSTAVWSFHNTNIAFGFSANSGAAPARYRRHQSGGQSSRYCQRQSRPQLRAVRR